jgi:hypothetical protein
MLTQTYMIHNAEKELRAYITFDAMHRLLDHTTKMKRKAPNERIRQHGLIIMQISLIQSIPSSRPTAFLVSQQLSSTGRALFKCQLWSLHAIKDSRGVYCNMTRPLALERTGGL